MTSAAPPGLGGRRLRSGHRRRSRPAGRPHRGGLPVADTPRAGAV